MVCALVLFLPMQWLNRHASLLLSLTVNSVLILLFLATIVKKDFPLSSLPVIGKKFRK